MGTRLSLLNYKQREKYTPVSTTLQEGSSRRRAATYTAHNKQKRRKSLTSEGCEHSMPAIKRLRPTYSSQHTAPGIGNLHCKTSQSSKYGQMPATAVVFIKHKLEQCTLMQAQANYMSHSCQRNCNENLSENVSLTQR